MRLTWLAPLWLGLAACSGDEPLTTDPPVPCTYPEPASVMTLDEVIPAFAWPEAIHADGRTGGLDLQAAACPDLGDIDWSPFDVLLFVSLPAW